MSRLDRLLSWLARAWAIWAHTAGIAVIALGIGVGLVQALSGRDAVITATNVRVASSGGPPFPTMRVPYRGAATGTPTTWSATRRAPAR